MDGSSKLQRYCCSSERYWSNVSSSIPCNGKLHFEGLHSCNSLPVVVLQKVACQKMLSLDHLNTKQRFTEISIFVLIPKIEMLLYRLVVMEVHSMTSTPCKIIGWWENIFATFTFCMSSAFDKEGVPVELTNAIMCMSVKHANHKPKECIFHLFWEATVLNFLRKCATNVICTTNPGTKNIN